MPKWVNGRADDKAAELIAYEMGAPAAMSTPGKERGECDSFMGPFSGKLSCVTHAREESVPLTPPVEPPVLASPPPEAPPELGGRLGPDPTRFGDWELRGRCIDF
jgi:Protein of unknown function (DUF1674)